MVSGVSRSACSCELGLGGAMTYRVDLVSSGNLIQEVVTIDPSTPGRTEVDRIRAVTGHLGKLVCYEAVGVTA